MRRNTGSINIGIFADKYVGAKTVEYNKDVFDHCLNLSFRLFGVV